jgi:hypothetical protein
MKSLHVKILILFLLLILGYVIITSFTNIITPIFNNPSLLLESVNLWILFLILIILSLWIYSLVKVIESTYDNIKHGSKRDWELKQLNRKMKSLDVFMDTAEKEFMHRKISKQTFDDIQRIAGKKMVEIKAKKKEMKKPRK